MRVKKILFILGILIIIPLAFLFLLTGKARNDVFLRDFELSQDGKIMTLKVGVSSSAGYVRGMKRTSGSTNGYYTFYSTFGINSRLGSKDTFTIELDQNIDEIYFYNGNGGYKLILIKNQVTQEWERIKYLANGNLKLNLLDKEDIIKISIDSYSQDNIYFEYSEKYVIEKIYNLFIGLETRVVNRDNDLDNVDEIYKIMFICDEEKAIYSDKLREDISVEVYRIDNKYYVYQVNNGVYEIDEEDFNLIKSFVKI